MHRSFGVPHACLYTVNVRIALGQINTTIGDFAGNSAKIIDYAQRARSGGAELVMFPELDLRLSTARPGRAALVCRAQSPGGGRDCCQTEGIAVIGGLVTPANDGTGKSVLNSAALLRDGKIAFVQSKRLLPTYDVFDEMRNFAPADSQQLFPSGGKQVALTICEDAWNDKNFWDRRLYGVDPVEDLMRAGGTGSAEHLGLALLSAASASCDVTCWRPSRASTTCPWRW